MDAEAGELRRSEQPGLDVTISARYHWSVARQLTPTSESRESYLTTGTLPYVRLYNAAASPASRLRSAASLAIIWLGLTRTGNYQNSRI